MAFCALRTACDIPRSSTPVLPIAVWNEAFDFHLDQVTDWLQQQPMAPRSHVADPFLTESRTPRIPQENTLELMIMNANLMKDEIIGTARITLTSVRAPMNAQPLRALLYLGLASTRRIRTRSAANESPQSPPPPAPAVGQEQGRRAVAGAGDDGQRQTEGLHLSPPEVHAQGQSRGGTTAELPSC